MANEAAGIGDNSNEIDFAQDETSRLDLDYRNFVVSARELAEEARALPEAINNDEDKSKVVSLIKRLRDCAKRSDGLREMEKVPHLRRGQAVDNFFNRITDALARRDRKAKPGIADVLQARLTDYDERKLAEERERRRREAEAAEREAERLRKEQEAREREAEEARLAAERARKPETQAAKAAQAEEAADELVQAKVDAEIAARAAETAYVDTLAKPADIMRTRGEDGTLSTMATEPYAEVVDATKLDKEALWPFVKLDAKEAALRAWAKANGHAVQMEGAKIGRRNKSVVR